MNYRPVINVDYRTGQMRNIFTSLFPGNHPSFLPPQDQGKGDHQEHIRSDPRRRIAHTCCRISVSVHKYGAHQCPGDHFQNTCRNGQERISHALDHESDGIYNSQKEVKCTVIHQQHQPKTLSEPVRTSGTDILSAVCGGGISQRLEGAAEEHGQVGDIGIGAVLDIRRRVHGLQDIVAEQQHGGSDHRPQRDGRPDRIYDEAAHFRVVLCTETLGYRDTEARADPETESDDHGIHHIMMLGSKGYLMSPESKGATTYFCAHFLMVTQ